ncbi:hypothetical protein M1615_03905 [Patescibacteria group bacterium]|nr:hypothetical protein [Patescibacteria group bacterium]
MIRSRIRRRIDKESRITLVLSLFGVLLILIFGLKFGIPLLVNLSLFLEENKSQQETKTSTKQTEFLSPPILDPILYATNSAKISISGLASPQNNIKLYINDELIGETMSQKNGKFIFKNITLNQGQNSIKTRAQKNNSQSDFSQTQIITFTNKDPSLSIEAPTDGQSFSKGDSPILIKGKTDPGIRITINGFWAIVSDSGDFSYQLPLTNGDNQIKIKATDGAGNTTEKDLTVKYSS